MACTFTPHRIKCPEPTSSLESLISKILPNSKLKSTALNNVFTLSDLSDVMIFVHNITGDVGVYNDIALKYSFGPDPIHRDLYSQIQMLLEEYKLKYCIYVLYQTDRKYYNLQCITTYDAVYIDWKRSH